jgi:hypothetical protein
MFDGLSVSLGSAAGAAAAVIAAFWKYEDVASPGAKQTVTAWLKYGGPGANHSEWASHLVTAFNAIFGERHFTVKCFTRSCLASLIACVIMFCFWVVVRHDDFLIALKELAPEDSDYLRGVILAVGFVFAVLIFNCVPDYFSYMKTRIILKRIAATDKLRNVIAFAALDTVLSFLIFALPLALIGAFSEQGWHTAGEAVRDFAEAFALSAGKNEKTIEPGIFFYSALFVSAWAWLYALSALTARLIFQLFPRLLTGTVWLFDVEGHPLRSLGCIAGGMVFAGVLVARALET